MKEGQDRTGQGWGNEYGGIWGWKSKRGRERVHCLYLKEEWRCKSQSKCTYLSVSCLSLLILSSTSDVAFSSFLLLLLFFFSWSVLLCLACSLSFVLSFFLFSFCLWSFLFCTFTPWSFIVVNLAQPHQLSLIFIYYLPIEGHTT